MREFFGRKTVTVVLPAGTIFRIVRAALSVAVETKIDMDAITFPSKIDLSVCDQRYRRSDP